MDSDEYEEPFIKEKDLTNHLEAEPKKKKRNTQKMKNRHTILDTENLLKDNQISRAYEILISYDVFKNLTK